MELAEKVANFYLGVGDKTRIKILGFLYEKPHSASEIMTALKIENKAALSYHLKRLVEHDLIRYQKIGRNKIFKLADDHIAHILNDTILHIIGGPECGGTLDCSDAERINLKLVI